MEDQLINLIKINDKPKLRLMLEDIFNENKAQGYLSLNSARSLVINLFDTIKHFLLRYGVIAEQVFSEEYKFIDEIFQHDSIEEMKEIVFSVYDSCYDKVLLKLNMKENLEDKIIEYIIQNYTDKGLCIQKIADYFSLSRDYIARKFREKTHVKLTDYINLVRVDEAKVRLAESNCLISDIAEQVGFSNYRTFVRIFTNVTGISPKQYRNINKH